MSECVVRMERVPKNCDDECWGALSGECPWCDSIDGYKMTGNRPLNCPIVAVLPEKHGDLIDKQSFIKRLYMYSGIVKQILSSEVFELYLQILKDVEGEVNKETVIIPVEPSKENKNAD